MDYEDLKEDRTVVELRSMRMASVEANRDYIPTDGFTCDNCAQRFRCAFVYDAYNTNGDCLADK